MKKLAVEHHGSANHDRAGRDEKEHGVQQETVQANVSKPSR